MLLGEELVGGQVEGWGEFKKSTAELKEAVISVAGMPNKHGRGEMTGRPCDPAGGPDQRSGKL